MYGQTLLQKPLWMKQEYIAQLLPQLNSFLSLLKRIAIKWKSASQGQGFRRWKAWVCLIWGVRIICGNIPLLQIMHTRGFFRIFMDNFLSVISPSLNSGKILAKFCFLERELRIEEVSCFYQQVFILFIYVFYGQYLSDLTFSLFLKEWQLAKKTNCLPAAGTCHSCCGVPWNVMPSTGGSLQQKIGWTCRDTAQWQWVYHPLSSLQFLRISLPAILGICLKLLCVLIPEL